jgi:Protein of unknown function (DUF2917)
MSKIASIHPVSCVQARAGAFVVPVAQALGLHPRQASMIRITSGSAWITLGDGMDHFLEAGQSLLAPKGHRVVMESVQHGSTLSFDWQPVAQAQRERSPLRGHADSLAVQGDLSTLAQAVLDLRGAAGLAGRGVAGLAAALGLGLAALARSAHSSANRAHGRMAS